MKLRKDVEFDITIDEAFEAAMESCALDKLSLIIKLSRTIIPKEIKDIQDLMGKDNFKNACVPITELVAVIGATNG